MLGSAVGNYRILAKIAEGGMGTVYRAEHIQLGRSAAVKVLHAELSHNRDIVDRFFNEAKASTAIRHPGIVEVYESGYLASGQAYIAMELLTGEPLSRYLKRRGGRIPELEAAWLIRGICSALAAAHAKSIIHRDLKPDNVFMIGDASVPLGVRPKLLDFGIAKLTGSEISTSKTRTGSVMGTPVYMSPEQCKGTGEIDHRADIYALGCMLYEMLCGRPPFVSEGAGELIGAHLYIAPDSPRVYAPQVTPAMEATVLRLLAKQREQRFATADQLAGHLADVAAGGSGMYPARPTPTAQTDSPPTVAMRPSKAVKAAKPAGGRARDVELADAPTVMESIPTPPPVEVTGGSGPIPGHAAWASGPAEETVRAAPAMPTTTPHPPTPHPPTPHPATPPHPMMYGHGHDSSPHAVAWQPMPTPHPPTPHPSTTLSGAAAVRQAHAARPRAKWWVAIAVVVLFGAASALTTYLIMGRGGGTRSAGGETPEPPPPPPVTIDAAPAVTPPPPASVDAAPAVTPPPPVAADAAPAAVKPGSEKSDRREKRRERKRDKQRGSGSTPPGPIETDL